jgi:hypothetical protein
MEAAGYKSSLTLSDSDGYRLRLAVNSSLGGSQRMLVGGFAPLEHSLFTLNGDLTGGEIHLRSWNATLVRTPLDIEKADFREATPYQHLSVRPGRGVE